MSTAPLSIVNDKIHPDVIRPIRATIVPNPNLMTIMTVMMMMMLDQVVEAVTVVLWRGPHAMDTTTTIVLVNEHNSMVEISRNAYLMYDNVDMAPCDYNH